MSNTLAPDDVSHYYQRRAELSTLPFWRREEFAEPTGPDTRATLTSGQGG
jgi:hypothetical protein